MKFNHKNNLVIFGYQSYLGNSFYSIYKNLLSNYDNIFLVGSIVDKKIEDNIIYCTYVEFINQLNELCHNTIILYFTHYGRPKSSTDTIDQNIFLIQDLLNALPHKPQNFKIIYISSGGGVYGEVEYNIKIKETHICNPISDYGISKYQIENLIIKHSLEKSFNFLILRPSNIFGSIFQRYDTGIIGYLEKNYLENYRFQIYGANIIRDYLHIIDFSSAMFCIINSNIQNEIFNISSSIGYNNLQIFENINKILKFNNKQILKYEIKDKRHFDVSYNVLSNKKLRSKFNWNTTINLIDYLNDKFK